MRSTAPRRDIDRGSREGVRASSASSTARTSPSRIASRHRRCMPCSSANASARLVVVLQAPDELLPRDPQLTGLAVEGQQRNLLEHLLDRPDRTSPASGTGRRRVWARTRRRRARRTARSPQRRRRARRRWALPRLTAPAPPPSQDRDQRCEREGGCEKERSRERVRDRPVELILELGEQRPVVVGARTVLERRGDVRYLAVCPRPRRAPPAPRAASRSAGCGCRAPRRHPRAMPRPRCDRARDEDRREQEQAQHHAGVARRDRPAPVDDLLGASRERALGEGREREPDPRADEDLRRDQSTPTPPAAGAPARTARPRRARSRWRRGSRSIGSSEPAGRRRWRPAA